MSTAYFRNKFNIYSNKIVIIFFLVLISGMTSVKGQNRSDINLPNYDDRWLHYGFQLGVHSSMYKLKYSNAFTSPDLASLQAIYTKPSIGFSVGFIANFRISEFWNFRVQPKIGFYDFRLEYVYNDPQQPVLDELVESTFIEIPLLLKVKSSRMKNSRVYLIGGITPMFEANGKKKRQNDDRLHTESFNLAVEFGLGLDKYNEFYKFSPELRYSLGLLNMLGNVDNEFSEGIKYINTHTITLYFLFEGGK
ncbi:porin family protein [Mangrovivirga sp. M17]|uniref:Porin family protein n=1 Tax=Mangrovivirga halotolerans TaxID=2993936 RepID=A0ABT3RN89_9BACT|nr:porin family protein [Mangrovivirga halotolerans]